MPAANAVSEPPTVAAPPPLRRAGATWVAATGAALVLVAAAVLVASRWDQIPDVVKLAMLMTGTGVCVLGGQKLKATLPATGNVVFHLGLLLVPANLAAIGIHLEYTLGQHLLTQGLVGVALFTAAAGATNSVVLRWASIASAPVLAAGLGALTPIPPLAVLVALAALAEWRPELRSRDAVLPLAIGAAFGPLALASIGVAVGTSAWATGAAAAVILGLRAQREHNLTFAALAIASVVTGAGTTALAADVSGANAALGLAAAFLLVQIVVLFAKDDEFWAEPLSTFATLTEIPALLGSIGAGAFILAFADSAWRSPREAAVFFTLGVAWWLADTRRAKGAAHANLAIAACVPTAVLLVSGSPSLAAVTLTLIAVACAVAKRPPAVLAAVASPLAILLPHDNPAVVVGVGLVLAAVTVAQAGGLSGRKRRDELVWLGGFGPGIALAAAAAAELDGTATALLSVGLVAVLVLVAERFDAALANICRAWYVLPFCAVFEGPAPRTVTVTAAIAALLGLDALRLRRPELAGIAAITSHATVVALAIAAGFTVGHAGVALALAAVVWVGFAATVGEPWDQPLGVAAAVAAVGALLVASGDQQAFTAALAIVGVLAVAVGASTRVAGLAHAGGVGLVVASVMQLDIAGVQLVEAYLVPVALYLAVAGEHLRRGAPTSSWITAAPAPLLLGGAAVLERVDGGAAVHALIAAVVGAAAVAVGGSRRQAGPLFTGTAVLALLGINESWAALAGVPAWGWIGFVGVSLLGVAVLIERTETSPVAVSRRLVAVISEQFE